MFLANQRYRKHSPGINKTGEPFQYALDLSLMLEPLGQYKHVSNHGYFCAHC